MLRVNGVRHFVGQGLELVMDAYIEPAPKLTDPAAYMESKLPPGYRNPSLWRGQTPPDVD